MPMTGFQRAVVAIGATLLAFRLLLPAKYMGEYGSRTDFYTTMLQAMGIFVVTAALFTLGPAIGYQRLWNNLKRQRFGYAVPSPARRTLRRGLLTLAIISLVVALAAAGKYVAVLSGYLPPCRSPAARLVRWCIESDTTPERRYVPSTSAWPALRQFRAAYPEYNDLDDATLARRIIAKFPACREALEEVAMKSPPGVKTTVSDPARFQLEPECTSK